MGMGVILSEHGLLDWMGRAGPGESIVYHLGHLGADRAQPFCTELARVADHAMRLAERGQVLLVQKRIGAGRFAYLAIKAASPRPLGTF